ncbi:uncharacterized protein F4812DRAFT_470243 [Daldinia caldariorum]|uniref:uncharacterized protein n=1 Tax=Daldinia caldariorum TaxID=326644 RepID=UPI0020084CC1|nr:uncharacterized protein F4812DRAFT_470243 [Daldinia caldariorum]KAI1469140.1 hypothetical protein F4812DRAFT_470243 [Daldinia caldariorum]
MANNSNSAAYNGEALPKPTHRFTKTPPTSHPCDKESLRDYRLQVFRDSPKSAPLAHNRTPNPGNLKRHHKAEVAAELEAILARLR